MIRSLPPRKSQQPHDTNTPSGKHYPACICATRNPSDKCLVYRSKYEDGSELPSLSVSSSNILLTRDQNTSTEALTIKDQKKLKR